MEQVSWNTRLHASLTCCLHKPALGSTFLVHSWMVFPDEFYPSPLKRSHVKRNCDIDYNNTPLKKKKKAMYSITVITCLLTFHVFASRRKTKSKQTDMGRSTQQKDGQTSQEMYKSMRDFTTLSVNEIHED